MTGEEKAAFKEWLRLNGGEEGSLYKTFPDEELEQVFLTAYTGGRRNVAENVAEMFGVCISSAEADRFIAALDEVIGAWEARHEKG